MNEMKWYNRVQTEYIINEEKRVVVCQITAIDDLNMRLVKYGFNPHYNYSKVKTYRGIARCHPDDVWNVTYGKRLAEYRASKKRVKDVNQEIEKFIDKLQKCSLALVKYGVMKQPRYPELSDIIDENGETEVDGVS